MEKYLRNNELITADLDEDLVMLDIEQGKYFSLNPVAKRIWELLEEEKSIEDLIQLLIKEFDVEKVECLNDVQEHLKGLLKLKLVSKM